MITAEPTTRPGWKFGSTVKNGEVRYFSVSSLQKAEGCLRQWIYHYVHGIKEPSSPAMERGTLLHAQVEHYLKTGDRSDLESQVLKGLHFLPPPGKDLNVEWQLLERPFSQNPHDSKDLLAAAPLKIGGVPLLGAIDLWHSSGYNYGGEDGPVKDPDGTVEVFDHKFIGRLSSAKSATQVASTIQMRGYARWTFEVLPKTKHVRLSHGYYPAQGEARKATSLVSRDDIYDGWASVEALADNVRSAVTLPIDDVPANLDACFAYGRLCPAADKCSARRSPGLAAIFGESGAEAITGVKRKLPVLDNNSCSTGVLGANVTSNMENMTTPSTPPAPGSVAARLIAARNAAPEILAEKRKLLREEVCATYPGISENIVSIRGYSLGFPTLTGELAKAYAHLNALPESARVEGTGDLASSEVGDYATLLAALGELREAFPEKGVSPPVAAEAPVAPTKKGRPAKSAVSDERDVVLPPRIQVSEEDLQRMKDGASKQPITVEPITGQTVNFFLDCLVTGMEITPLRPIVDEILERLAVADGCVARGPDGAPLLREDGSPIATDVRLAGQEGRLAFGRWKGALAAALREREWTPGNYFYEGAFGEVGQVVTETMPSVVRRLGGVVCRGVR